ncbi:MAG: glycosyltransferase [Pyrinomonadaceae bacterium]
MKKRVLIFCEYYPPSHGGGGMYAMVNIVERFHGEYDFFVVAGDRMALGDDEVVPKARRDDWNEVGHARVQYISTESLERGSIEGVLKRSKPDAVFLNSAFSRSALRFLRARRSGAARSIPVIIAPCGEFLPNALATKALKKQIFLVYARAARLYENVIWRASSETEIPGIVRVIGRSSRIFVAPDLTPREILPDLDLASKPKKTSGSAKFVFLARIVKIKNLHFLLELLREIHTGTIEIEIIGHEEDKEYWTQCRSLIDAMPTNIKVNCFGPVAQDEALERLKNAHYFVLPTLSENFGFVFMEALAAGCPLLISDRTDWGAINDVGAGWVVPLSERSVWLKKIENCVAQGQEEYAAMSRSARDFAVKWLAEPHYEQATADLLESAVGSSGREAAA